MKCICLLSSGIDSPVATYLVSKKTDKIVLLHADGRPFTDDRENDNFIKIAKYLKNLVTGEIKAYIIPHGTALSEFKKNCQNKYTCVFCKRMLVRYAEQLAEKEKADGIVMGDSLGQVASQTLQNLRIVEQAVRIPILRPLIGFDKDEIVKIAKKIGTYDLSILPSDGCSAVPNKPSTMAKLEVILDEENKINVNEIIKEAVKKTILVTL